MIDFKIPKIFKTIPLKDYAKEFGEESIEVWANFPKAVVMERDDILTHFHQEVEELEALQKESDPDKTKLETLKSSITELNDKMKAWYGQIWFKNGNQLSKEDVSKLFEQSDETDPMFMNWLIEKTFELINEHREARKN